MLALVSWMRIALEHQYFAMNRAHEGTQLLDYLLNILCSHSLVPIAATLAGSTQELVDESRDMRVRKLCAGHAQRKRVKCPYLANRRWRRVLNLRRFERTAAHFGGLTNAASDANNRVDVLLGDHVIAQAIGRLEGGNDVGVRRVAQENVRALQDLNAGESRRFADGHAAARSVCSGCGWQANLGEGKDLERRANAIPRDIPFD